MCKFENSRLRSHGENHRGRREEDTSLGHMEPQCLKVRNEKDQPRSVESQRPRERV